MRGAAIVVVIAACGHGGPAPGVSAPVPIAIDAGAPVAHADAAYPIALPGGCHATGDGVDVFPPFDDDAPVTTSYRDAKGVHTGAVELCDLPDRVVVVDDKTSATSDPMVRKVDGAVIVTPRGKGAISRSPIAASSSCVDRCNGPGGGFAGCSLGAGCTIASAAPGARVIRLGVDERDAGDGKSQVACGPVGHEYLAACATRERLVLMTSAPCRPGGGDASTWRLRLAIYETGAPRADGADAAAPTFTRNGDFYAPDSRNGVWAYRFPDGGDGKGDAILMITVGAKPNATLTFAGATSACAAWTFSPAAL